MSKPRSSATLPAIAEPPPSESPPPITVLTNVLAAVAKWTSADDTRLHLRLVVFRDDELIATDGHRLVRVPCPTYGHTFGIDRAHVLAAAKAQHELEAPRPRAIQLWPADDGHVRLRLTGPPLQRNVSLKVPAGRVEDYPPIEQVMPTTVPAVGPQNYVMDPRYLAAVEEVTSAMQPDTHRGVTLAAWGPPDERGELLGSMLFTNAGGARFVIMPMRAP